jgi:C-terminal processing protease CtpA/Prc
MKNNAMKFLKVFLIAIVVGSLTISCFEDRDDNVILASEINDFVWKGMNAIYLYKAEIPNLANDRFSSNEEYGNYLNSYSTPEGLFESLIYDRPTTDRFSFIVDDYIAWEQLNQGSTISNGLRYFYNGSSTLAIRQVVPNSPADLAGLTRGQYIIQIDGQDITEANVNSLLSQDTYTLYFADLNDNGTPETSDDFFTANGQTQTLTKTLITDNPVYQTKIIDVDGEKLGYILYNRFNDNFNTQLNDAFGEFKTANIKHLVIDLRYNPGGSVLTASLLGSMVTGQFNGQVFSKLIYNDELQQLNNNYNFVNNFDNNAINSLSLDKVYVLTTEYSASASELLINSLKQYITVVQVGDYTYGKTQASLTVYDSPDLLTKNNINPNHTYAMQPLVANSINVNDEPVPGTGLPPDLEIYETFYNLGSFGDVNEPLLARAIADIRGTGRYGQFNTEKTPIFITQDPSVNVGMYIDPNTVPSELRKHFMNQ